MDPRYHTLAKNLVSHSVHLQAGEKVLIHAFDVPENMTLALIRAARECGAHPFVQLQSGRIDRECIWREGGTISKLLLNGNWRE